MILPTTNTSVTILAQITDAYWKTTWEQVWGTISAYINQISEELVPGFSGAGSFLAFRMMTDGNHGTLSIWGRMSDGTYTYDVRGKTVHDSLVGTSHQYILTRPFSWT